MASSRDVLTRSAPSGITQRYGELPDQLVEWFHPSGEPRAIIGFLHGGFWREAYDRGHIRPLCNALAAEGYTVGSIEYRRTGGAGGWPQTFEDVKLAVATLRQGHATVPVLLSGHSAGGQLALWAASFTDDLAAVVPLAPVADLRRCHDLDLDGGAVDALLGGGPAEVPQRYGAADPMRLTSAAPVTIVHGNRDDRVPIDFSRDYCAEHGATLRELPGVEHFALIDPLSSAWPVVCEVFGSMTSRVNPESPD